jgi:hypothetical protein
MTGEAKAQDLLYVSAISTSSVYVYSYPKGELVGTLTGFDMPQGLCSDTKGNVFVANYRATNLIEYAHGGTTPIATIADPNYWPEGCAVDRTTGNLAVTDNGADGEGGMAVYLHATGSPHRHRAPHMFYYFFCGYDDQGDLFVDGENYASIPTTELAEISGGAQRLVDITMDQSIGLPGGVQWDGNYLAVGDAENGVIYQFKISGNTGTREGTTSLNDSSTVNQFWIQDSAVIGANFDSPSIMFWNYPAGGQPRKTIETHHKWRQVFGATISVAN